MQVSSSTVTMPSSRLTVAPVGHTSSQTAFSQCMQFTGSQLSCISPP